MGLHMQLLKCRIEANTIQTASWSCYLMYAVVPISMLLHILIQETKNGYV